MRHLQSSRSAPNGQPVEINKRVKESLQKSCSADGYGRDNAKNTTKSHLVRFILLSQKHAHQGITRCTIRRDSVKLPYGPFAPRAPRAEISSLAFPLLVMMRIHLLLQSYILSDPNRKTSCD